MNGAKMICLWQPWASLMAHSIKWIETRGNATPHRGLTFIHAAQRKPDQEIPGVGLSFVDGIGELMWWLAEPFTEEDAYARGLPPDGDLHGFPLPLGCVVAVGELVDVVPMVDFMTEREDIRRRIEQIEESLWLRTPGEIPATCITDQLPYGDFTPGRFGHLYRNVQALAEPVPARGHQSGYRDVDPEAYAAVAAQVDLSAVCGAS